MPIDAKTAILSFIQLRIMETYDGPAEDVLRAARELGVGEEATVMDVECEWSSWDEHPGPTGVSMVERQVVGKDKNGNDWFVGISPQQN